MKERRGSGGAMPTHALHRRSERTGLPPTALLLRLSLVLGATAGFTLGLGLLWSIASADAGLVPWAALTQVHGQVQVLGFVGLFILGTASQLLPGFLARPLLHRGWIIAGGSTLAGALVLRAVTQPLDPSTLRSAGLWLSAIGEVMGVGLCLASYADLARQSIQPADLWRRLVAIGFGFLAVSVILNTVAVAYLARGKMIVPAGLDAALVEIELRGFVVFLVFGVSRKILPRFLLLATPDDHLLRAGAGSYLAGVVLVALGSLTAGTSAPAVVLRLASGAGAWLELVGVVLYLLALRLYAPPIRASGAPNVTEPARRWLKLAFAWLVIASVLSAVWGSRALLGGPPAGFFEQTAERHALAQGFLMLAIVAYGGRILPGYSAWATTHPRPSELIVGLLSIGALLRVIGELTTAARGTGGELLAGLGGTLSVLGFAIFAVALWRSLGRRYV